MRVLRTLLTGFFIILLIAVGAFFGSREALLWWASRSLASSVQELARAETKGTFAQQCQRSIGTDVFGKIDPKYQLRFLNHTEYALEVVCDVAAEPTLITRKNLPVLVSKVPGSSGLLPEEPLSGVRLTAFATELALIREYIGSVPEFFVRERSVVLSDGVVLADGDAAELGVGPNTSCEGYGYICCDAQTQMGAGESISGIESCPATCFSSCITRPVLLSFTTAPFLNPQTRSVTIAPGGTVSFHYVADAGKSSNLQVMISFGDGKTEQLQGSTGSVEHVYSCPAGNCQYKAQIELKDAWGVSSLPGKLDTVAVNVSSGV
ncbi:MAG: hypothetical protein O2840_01850 [bacterium]|nr:hypothetical protein [bacterium]